MLQTNNNGVRSQCLSHTGSAPAHRACSLPAHTTQALGCSAGNYRGRPWAACTSQVQAAQVQALGQSSEAQTRLGLRFVPFPGPSSSGDEVFGERRRCDLSHPLSLPLGFLGVQPAHFLRQMLTVQNPKKS